MKITVSILLRSVKRPTSENKIWWTSTVTRLQLWRTRDSPRKKIWWISTDPTEDRSVKVRVTANSLNDLRQITQNLVCRGLVSSGNHDVVSTTQGWQNPSCCLNNKSWQHQTGHPSGCFNQRDSPQESVKLMDLNKSWHIKFPKNRYQFNGDSTVSIRPTKDPRATV